MGAVDDPRVYGKLVTAAVTFGYLGSNIFYYKAGKAYKFLMEERDNKNAANALSVQPA